MERSNDASPMSNSPTYCYTGLWLDDVIKEATYATL
jgi:hypothetical protein